MNIGLVTDIPDKLVLGRAEHAMQGNSQLYDSKIRPEMAAVFGQHLDHLLPNLQCQLLQLWQRQFFDVKRFVHHVEISAHKAQLSVLRLFR